ncbi:MAG TPA: protein kinase [Gemmatimonadaceae bacterium]|nr:protein kinase [Gemmatimonadaceae bacterium]
MTSPLLDRLQTVLGAQYKLVRELGRGGMATVYLATDQKHGRQVALKVLHPDLAATLGPERFRREIGFAATLSHPHILTVLDSGETTDGQLWFTMPYVEGETLRDHLRRDKQLSIDEALRITREIASALDYAHEKGVVHRDIKPENLLLTKRGDALLADFGIARALGGGSDTGGATLTQTGLSVGTPQYMSPEQASGERELTSRSDIYTLAVVCYEMLAGEPPFTAPSTQAMIAKMMTSDAPSVRTHRPSVPPGVDAVLQKALQRVPADRWATAAEFSHALEAAERSALTGTAPASIATAPLIRGKRKMPATALALILGFLVGGGMLFAWRTKSHESAAGASGATRVAVLPFENVGDTSDAYFADGVTDAVRGKLTGVPGLEVIGSASSGRYRKSALTPQQIGQELGVRYILVGRVHWAKGAGGTSRVQVSPELIDVTTAADKWQQPFDAPLTDVFMVQADIAGKVAHELQVALSPAAKQTLIARPTDNLDAYDAYLRGLDIRKKGISPAVLHRAAAEFTEAIRQDSNFALAWASLGDAIALEYNNGIPSVALGDSVDRVTAHALALEPDLADALAARSTYFRLVRADNASALEQTRKGLARQPANVRLLVRNAAVEQELGRWEAALEDSRKAALLDPQSANQLVNLGDVELRLRHYPEAQRALARALALAPDNPAVIENNIQLHLMRGDLRGARTTAHEGASSLDPSALLAYIGTFYDLGWVLDSAQERSLLSLGDDAFDNDSTTRAIVFAQQYRFRGDSSRMRAYADTAQAGFARQLKDVPGDRQRQVLYGLMLSYLGRRKDAIAFGDKAADTVAAVSGTTGLYYRHQTARIYIALGEQGKALDILEYLLKQPYYLTPEWLKIDPNFAPLRGNPRFQRIIAGAAVGN